MKSLALALVAALAICLSGCAGTPGLLGSTTVTTRQVQLAADAFNSAESAVIVYQRLPLCSSAPAPCRDMAIMRKADSLIRAGVKVEKRLVTAARASTDGTVQIDDFNALVGITATLKSLTGS